MIKFQRTGYEKKSLLSNIALGVMDGTDAVLWCCVFAAILFPGALSVFFPIGLTVLFLGWALISLYVALTSAVKVNVVTIDEQAVVIIGTVGGVLAAEMGPAAVGPVGISTMLAVFAISSLCVAAVFFAVVAFKVVRLLELIPYPVICGFMAGIAWLLVDAGVMVATDSAISSDLLPALQNENNLLKLVLCAAGGAVMLWLTNQIARPWVLPVASIAVIFVFYGWVWVSGATKQGLISGGWLFDIGTGMGGVASHLDSVSFTHIDWSFIASVVPQIASIGFLCVLNAAMAMSAMTSIKFATSINSADEIKRLGLGNLFCGFVCCPPGYTDAAASLLYDRFGASTRWMPIASSVLLLVVAPIGIQLISFLPLILIGALIFLFGFQMIKEWMFENVRKFDLFDYLIVWSILLVIIIFGFVEGIILGIFLTFCIFSLRYAMISSIRGEYTVNSYRSSVERSPYYNNLLDAHGDKYIVITLRGYLFFGTTNFVRDRIKYYILKDRCSLILIDFHQVTGIDVSALQTFHWIKRYCEANDVQLLYSSLPLDAIDNVVAMGAVSESEGKALIFPSIDFAIEYVEEKIIRKFGETIESRTAIEHLAELTGDEAKAKSIIALMSRVEIHSGSYLLRQGERDDGFYILEKGALSAILSEPDGNTLRIKKFSAGSLIGELSGYMDQKKRTTSIVADEASVLYHFNMASIEGPELAEVSSAIHELVARTLTNRIDYMNRRLAKETLR